MKEISETVISIPVLFSIYVEKRAAVIYASLSVAALRCSAAHISTIMKLDPWMDPSSLESDWDERIYPGLYDAFLVV